MIHSYDVEIAEKHGIVCAVLLYNIYHWIEENKETGTNFHDDRYWTYDTTETLARHFPEMSERTIQRAMKKLEDENLIVKGNFNKSGFDRTVWYSLTNLAYSIMTICHHPFRQNGGMDSDKMAEPIPHSTTNSYTNRTDKEIDKSISMSDSGSLTQRFRKILEEWNAMAAKTGIPEITKITPTSNRGKWLRARIAEYGEDAILEAIRNVGASDYLPGKSFFSFDWFVRPNNFIKVLEGNYGKASRKKSAEPEQPTEKQDKLYDELTPEEIEEMFPASEGWV